MELTQQSLQAVLHYNPDTGVFLWRERGQGRRPGPAGCIRTNKDGKKYRVISVGGRLQRAHRLAWLYVTGSMPAQTIDHQDGDGLNNRWLNLRDVTQKVNSQNQRRAHKNSKTGLLGVDYREGKKNPWRARIDDNGKFKTVGHFATAEAATAAHLTAKRHLHEGCTL